MAGALEVESPIHLGLRREHVAHDHKAHLQKRQTRRETLPLRWSCHFQGAALSGAGFIFTILGQQFSLQQREETATGELSPDFRQSLHLQEGSNTTPYDFDMLSMNENMK